MFLKYLAKMDLILSKFSVRHVRRPNVLCFSQQFDRSDRVNGSALGNELVNIFRNASIGTTVKIITLRLKLQKKLGLSEKDSLECFESESLDKLNATGSYKNCSQYTCTFLRYTLSFVCQ